METKIYEYSIKYKLIEELCGGKTPRDIEEEYNVKHKAVVEWLQHFIIYGASDEEQLPIEEKTRLEQLRKQAINYEQERKKINPKSYEPSFKYKVLEELCDGKDKKEIAQEYNVSTVSIMGWLRRFIAHGTFDDEQFEQLSIEEKTRLEKLKEKAIEIEKKITRTNKYEPSLRYKVIEEFCNGRGTTEIAQEYNISTVSIMNWLRQFVQNGNFNERQLSTEEKQRLKKLRKKAREAERGILRGRIVFEASFKYKVIKEFCNGKKTKDIAQEYNISTAVITKWLREFIANGTLDNKQLTIKGKERLEELRKKATQALKNARKRGGYKGHDASFKYEIIEQLCEGKEMKLIADEYEITTKSIIQWLREFIKNNTFDNEQLAIEETKLEELRKKAIEIEQGIKRGGKRHTGREASFKYRVIEEFSDGKEKTEIAQEYNISEETVMRWVKFFIENGNFDGDALSKEEEVRLEELRKKAIETEQEKRRERIAYKTSLKYKIIEELCDGKEKKEIAQEFKVSTVSIVNWLKYFIDHGNFGNDEVLSLEERIRLEELRKRAIEKHSNMKRVREKKS